MSNRRIAMILLDHFDANSKRANTIDITAIII